jgi:hypothetical protein
MRITEVQLRRIIRKELNEDLQGFLRRTADSWYGGDPEMDPTFEKDPEFRSLARSVKRAWAAEADHSFMDSVTKIHWMKNPSRDNIQRMLSGGRDEISTMGYISGPYRSGPPGMDNVWGKIGLVVQGRTTLAANSMDTIYSGYHKNIPQNVREKYRSSGLRKRPIGFSEWKAENYILDAASFDASGQGENEFIVGGWRVVAVVLTEQQFQNVRTVLDTDDALPWQIKEWTENFKTIRDLGIPYLKRKHKNLAETWLAVYGGEE